MRKAGTKIDSKSNKNTMLGKVQDLHFTTSGHYCIPLDRKNKIINNEDQNTKKSNVHQSKKLLKDEGVNDDDFLKIIEEVEKSYVICCKYKHPPSKPVVCSPLSNEFNESFAMDIKYSNNHLVLDLSHCDTRFSSAAVVRSKH